MRAALDAGARLSDLRVPQDLHDGRPMREAPRTENSGRGPPRRDFGALLGNPLHPLQPYIADRRGMGLDTSHSGPGEPTSAAEGHGGSQWKLGGGTFLIPSDEVFAANQINTRPRDWKGTATVSTGTGHDRVEESDTGRGRPRWRRHGTQLNTAAGDRTAACRPASDPLQAPLGAHAPCTTLRHPSATSERRSHGTCTYRTSPQRMWHD